MRYAGYGSRILDDEDGPFRLVSRKRTLRRRVGANLEDVVPALDQDLLTKELNYIASARSDFVCSLGKNLRYRYLMLSPNQSRFRSSRTS